MGIVCSGSPKNYIGSAARSKNDVVFVRVSDNGFSPSHVVVHEGQCIRVEWNVQAESEDSSKGFNVVQVAGLELDPVPGGYSSGRPVKTGSYNMCIRKTGHFSFRSEFLPISKILTVNAIEKPITEIKITAGGFEPEFVEILEGDAVRWSCDIEESTLPFSCFIQEMGYCFEHCGFLSKKARVDVRPTHERTFQDTGMYYFCLEKCGLEEKNEESLAIKCGCAIRVMQRNREFTVQLSDEGLQPNFIQANVNDRIWLDCSSGSKKFGKILDAAVFVDTNGTKSSPLVTAKLSDSSSPSRVAELVSHRFLEPGVYHFVYKMADSSQLSGCLVVLPTPKQHVIEIKEGEFRPTLNTVRRGERVWWSHEKQKRKCLPYVKEVNTCVPPNRLSARRKSQRAGCPCRSLPQLQNFVSSLGLLTHKFEDTGVFTYQIQDSSGSSSASYLCSIVVQQNVEHHMVRVRDQGFTPNIVNVHPEDFVWWYWENTTRLHNVRQVSHQRTSIRDGFDSGDKTRATGAFRNCFTDLGVFYFASNGLPEVFGAVVVTPECQVHKLLMSGRSVGFDPLVIATNDCVCWMWSSDESYSVVEVSTPDEINKAEHHSMNRNINIRCHTRLFIKPGMYHFVCTAHQQDLENQDGDSFLHTVLVDPVSYSCMIGLSSEGFKPSALTIEKSQSVLWTWKDQESEKHNIIHVRPPQAEQNLIRVRGLSAFDSGPVTSSSTFFHTFDMPGTYFITSEGTKQQLCVIDVLEKPLRVSSPEIRDTGRNGGNVECGCRVFLTCDTDGAEVFYTTDGSFPVECNPNLSRYEDETGIVLSWPGFVIIRAVAKKKGLLTSDVFTSKLFWVLHGALQRESEDETGSVEEDLREEILRWHWLSCKPYISVVLVCDNTFHIDVSLGKAADVSWIRGFQVLLNYTAYGGWFSSQCRGVVVSGLIGRKVYHVAVAVFPTQDSFGPQLSNEVVISCPAVSSSGGPLVSLEVSTSPQSLVIIWPCCVGATSFGAATYSVYINGQLFGEQIVPDPESDYCRVLFESSSSNEVYTLCVACHVSGTEQRLYSNEVEFALPVPEEIVCAVQKPSHGIVTGELSTEVDEIDTECVSRELLLIAERTSFESGQSVEQPPLERLCLKSLVNKLETIPEERRLELRHESVSVQDGLSAADIDEARVFENDAVKGRDNSTRCDHNERLEGKFSKEVKQVMFAADQENVLASESHGDFTMNGELLINGVLSAEENNSTIYDQGVVGERSTVHAPFAAEEDMLSLQVQPSVIQCKKENVTGFDTEPLLSSTCQEGDENVSPVQHDVDVVVNERTGAVNGEGDDKTTRVDDVFPSVQRYQQMVCDEDNRNLKSYGDAQDIGSRTGLELDGHANRMREDCPNVLPGHPNSGPTEGPGEPSVSNSGSESEQDEERNEDVVGAVNFEEDEQNNGVLRLEEDFERSSKESVSKGFANKGDEANGRLQTDKHPQSEPAAETNLEPPMDTWSATSSHGSNDDDRDSIVVAPGVMMERAALYERGNPSIGGEPVPLVGTGNVEVSAEVAHFSEDSPEGTVAKFPDTNENHCIETADANQKKPEKLLPTPLLVVKGTTSKTVTLEWEWKVPAEQIVGADIVYSLFILGGKFHGSINSDFCYNFEESPAKSMWPKQGFPLQQHSWRTTNTVIEITGLKQRCSYRLAVLGQLMPCARDSLSRVIHFTMPGPPRPPVIHVTALQDREVTLSWKAPREFGEATVVGYRVLKNGELYREALGCDTARTTVNELETGKDHRISVVAVTGHSVGDSEPSNVITIHCPTPPPSPQIYPKETTALGSVRVAWNRTELEITNDNDESAQFSFAVFRDGRLHGECPLDNVTDIFTEEHLYTIPNCEMGRKYEVCVKSYAYPRIIDDGRGGKLFVCGCYGDSSNMLELYCAGPPAPPVMWVSRIDCSGVTLRWERSREYGGVSLAGYRLYVDGEAWSDDLLPPECQETTLKGLTLGAAIRAQLAATTYDLAGPISEFNNQASDNSRYSRPFSDPSDSGVESSTSFLSKRSADDRQHACVMGPVLVVQYSNLVRKVNSVEVTEVACRSALVTWSFEETADRFVEPECVNLLCWKKGEKMDSARRHLVTGQLYIVRHLDPGTEYSLVLECTASHINDTKRQRTPINISLSSVATFKTGFPPDPPEYLHVVSSSEQSVRLAWRAPVERGVAVEMLHLNVMKVDRISSDPDMNFQLSPESRTFTVDFLAARTEYVFTLKALTKDDLLDTDGTSRCSLTSVSAWTNGVEPAQKLTVHARTPTSLLIGWQPSVPYGISFVKHYQLHYVENRLIRSRSRGKVGEVKDAGKKLWIESNRCEAEMEQLEPGTVYRVVVETVAGVADYSYEDDFEGEAVESASTVSSEPSFKTPEADILCLSEPLLVCTAAPPESPVLLVSGFTPTQIHLLWNKPLLVRPVVEPKNSFAVDQARGRVRSLRAYRLEVSGRVYAKLAANRTSFVVKKCKSGMKYTCVLVVVTGPEQVDGSRRKHETADAPISDTDTDEDNAISLSGCFEEAASKPVEVSLPRQDWGVSLNATYCTNKPAGSLRDSPCSDSGDEEGGVVVRWSIAGMAGNANGFRLVWYSSESDERNDVFLPSDASCYEIWSVLPRVVYTAFLEILDDREAAQAVFGPVHCQTPGPPSSPWIWCRSLSPYQFVVEWNEPVTYRNFAVRGYQVLLNNRRLDKMVERSQRRVTLHCQSSSVYRVSVIALSSDPLLGESPPSNVLKVCTPVALEGTMRQDPSRGCSRASFGITVNVLSTSKSSIAFEWNHSPEEVQTADHYVIKWSSVLQPQAREISLSLLQSSHVIDGCSPGTSHFIVVAAVKTGGDLVSRSEQYTIQTSAPVEKPKLQLRSCRQSGITLEWIKPISFGDAKIDCFVLLVNDDLEEELGYDCCSYKFFTCEPCKQYSFKLKAISTKPECDSDWSDTLIVTCPGAEKPVISRIPSKMVNCIKVGWETLTLKGGTRVENFKVYYLEDTGEAKTTHDVITDPQSVVHGPLPRFSEHDKLVNVSSDSSYWVVLQVELSLDCQPVWSLPIRTRSAVSPDPPEVRLEVEGLEERTWLERRICELTAKKDRLHRVVHLLENSVVVKGSKRKNLQEPITRSVPLYWAVSPARLQMWLLLELKFPANAVFIVLVVISGATDAMLEADSELADTLEAIKNYTGTISVVLRWPRPSDDGDAIVSGYQVFVNGDRYGKALSKPAMMVEFEVQLPVTGAHHTIAVQTLTDHPVGPSALSAPLKVTGEEFSPFVLFCYFDVHKRGKSWPASGCCSWEDSHSYELKQRKETSPGVFVPRGILTSRIPCPVCSVIDVFSARWRPLAPIGVAKMNALLFWSKWCLSSQKVTTFFMKFADEFKEQFSFITCCVRSDEPIMSHRQSLAEIIAERGWDRAGQHVLHLCGCYPQHGQRTRSARSGVIRDPDVWQLFGLLGTPTIVLLDSTGCISWHGRCCCRDASSFRTFLLHAFSQVSKTQCPVSRCEHCDLDTQDVQRTLTESDDESNGIRTEEFWDRSAELNSLHQRLHGAARPSSAFVTWPSPAWSQALKRDLGRPKTTSTAASSASRYNTPGRSKQALRTHSRSVTSYGKVTPRLTVAAKHRSIGGLSPSISDSSSGDKIPPITRRKGKRTLSQERGTVPRVKTKISVDDFTLA